MDVSVSNEFIKVYDYISKLEKDITDVAKEHYDTSIISYDEIDNTPENLSDFNNDLNFVTEQQVDDKIDSIEFPEQDDSNFLKKSGEDEQQCNIPTKFDSLQTKTQNQEDSSENVATTEFVHNLVKEGNEQTKSWVFGTYGNKRDDKNFVTEQQLQSTLTNYATKQNVEAVVDDAVEEAVQQLDIPTKTSQLQNDSGYITESDIPDDLVTSVNGQQGDVTIDIPTIPANVSAFNNDAGYITDPGVTSVNNQTGAVSVQENVQANWSATSGLAAILNKPALKRVATTGDYNDLDNLPTIPPTMTILSYGNSTWDDFLAAYNSNTLVYCRASSNSNPATGAQNRLAFMAYINNATNLTEVEFQYYRSVSAHTEAQQGDQMYVYKLTNKNKWTVTVRESYTKILPGTNITTSYGASKITLNAPTNVSAFANDAGYLTAADFSQFMRSPVTIWETDGAGLLASNQDISTSMTWQLTGLDMTPYKRIKIYTKAGVKTSGVDTDASNTPAVVLEMSLDNRAASPTGGHFLGSIVGQKPNDTNRLFTVTCAVSSDKTSFAVLRMSTLYGTAATANSDCNGYVFKIEGYYD